MQPKQDKKPRRCVICDLPPDQVAEINRRLILNIPMRDIARDFEVKIPTVSRHKINHVKKDEILERAINAVKLTDGQDVLGQYEWAYNECLDLYKSAKNESDMRLQDKAMSQIIQILDRYSKTYGLFSDQAIVQVNVTQRRIEKTIDSMTDEQLQAFLERKETPPALMAAYAEIESLPTTSPELIIDDDGNDSNQVESNDNETEQEEETVKYDQEPPEIEENETKYDENGWEIIDD